MPVIHQFFDRHTDVQSPVFDEAPATRVKQVHSDKVIRVNGPLTEWIEADAIVTDQPNLPIGVITADCAPVLFAGEGVIAAAHAGWRGALSGVLDNTIAEMQCDPKFIKAFIGPSITQKSYEVSIGFEEPFLDRDAEAERFFTSGAEGKLHFDLAGYCAFRLSQCEIRHVHIDGRDTLTNPDFHSYRGGVETSGRNLSAIVIKP